jgi:hypothetical protein
MFEIGNQLNRFRGARLRRSEIVQTLSASFGCSAVC